MAYEFKNIATVDLVEEVAKTSNVLIEEDGIIKRAPKSEVGGEVNGIIDSNVLPQYTSQNNITITQFDFAAIKEKLLAGKNVIIKLHCVFNYGNDYEVWANSCGICYDSTANNIWINWIVPNSFASTTANSSPVTIIISSTGECIAASYN